MQIVAVMGTPRKGNSYKVTQQIERLLTRKADVHLEYVFLGQIPLQACRGCYLCMAKGEQYCPLHDERDALVEKMQKADGVIFVSPVYASNVTGLMKNLMDRLAYNAHRPAFLGKPAMLVTTSAGPGTENTLKALSWFAYAGFEIAARVGLVVSRSPRYTFMQRKSAERQIEKAVRLFAKALTRGPVAPPLWRILQFHGVKANAMLDPDFYLADYQYYRDKAHYYVDGELSWWKRSLGRLYSWGAGKWMKNHFLPVREESRPVAGS